MAKGDTDFTLVFVLKTEKVESAQEVQRNCGEGALWSGTLKLNKDKKGKNPRHSSGRKVKKPLLRFHLTLKYFITFLPEK